MILHLYLIDDFEMKMMNDMVNEDIFDLSLIPFPFLLFLLFLFFFLVFFINNCFIFLNKLFILLSKNNRLYSKINVIIINIY